MVVAVLAGLTIGFSAEMASASEKSPHTIEVGISESAKIGRWMLVTVRVFTDQPDSQRYAVEAPDPEGRMVRYPMHLVSARTNQNPKGESIFQTVIKNGRIDGTIRVFDTRSSEDEVLIQSFLATGSTAEEKEAAERLRLKQSAFLIATLGHPAGFPKLSEPEEDHKSNSSSSRKTETQQPPHAGVRILELDDFEQLPTDSRGYDALDVLVISGKYSLDNQRSRALQIWIRNGGHLIFCKGSEFDLFRQKSIECVLPVVLGASSSTLSSSIKRQNEHISNWLPIAVTGQSYLPDLGPIETYAGGTTAIIFSGRAKVARIVAPQNMPDVAGKTLVTGRDGPLIVRAAFGLGQITFCGLDFHRPPLSEWSEINTVARRIIKDAHGDALKIETSNFQQLASSGIGDLGTQLNAIQEDYSEIPRTSSLFVMLWIALFVLIIGPVDYLLVHRVLKRPRLTWVTFPSWVILASWLALGEKASPETGSLQMNQLEIVDIDVTGNDVLNFEQQQQSVRVNSWMTLWSPETQRYDLSLITPGFFEGEQTGIVSPELNWNGVTEDIFGGMYRRGGVSFDNLSYRIAGDSPSMNGLPIRTRSTAHLKASWKYKTPGLIESQLSVSPTGQLRGTLKHSLPAPLTDWMLIHGTQVYFPGNLNDESKPTSLPAGKSWILNNSKLVSMDLSHWLSGVRNRVKRTKNTDGKIEKKFVSEQARYNPYSLDSMPFLQMLSFHRVVGGKKYTGLENHALSQFDLTGSLQLGRAILIGRIEKSAANLKRKSDDGKTELAIKPRRRITFVRIVLPVREIRPVFKIKVPTSERPSFTIPLSYPVKAPKPKRAAKVPPP